MRSTEKKKHLIPEADSTHPASQHDKAPSVSLTCFEDIARLAERRRDLALKSDFERYARPVDIAPSAPCF